jgi:hypothetical protein
MPIISESKPNIDDKLWKEAIRTEKQIHIQN